MNQIIDIKPQAMTYNAVHPEYAKFSPEEIKAKAFAKLQERIHVGQRQAMGALERIQREVPEDRIVPVQKLRFVGDDERGLAAILGDQRFAMHKHARGQFSQKLGFNGKFMNDLLEEGDWGRNLIAHNLSELAAHGRADDKFLVRSVNGQVRGVLGASYNTNDSRPALESMLNLAREIGAVLVEGVALDTRCSFKIMRGNPIEVFPGEWAIFGLSYNTSDYGHGAAEISGWIERLLCLNGATVTASYRKVHIGRRIENEVEYSTRTRKLNEALTISASRDMAKAILGDTAIEKLVNQVRVAQATELDADKALASIKGQVNKSEEQRIKEKFNSPDVELLPPGNTAWRFSNAISWLANQIEDQDRKLDLQELAGKVAEDPASVGKKAA